MLLKEFRFVLPISVEEYQIAQLYNVAEMSKEESHGDAGVEVLVNEPFDDENGKGQYTHKIYHLGSRVPRWINALAPKSALRLEEKAWNAYPFCKTILTNQFLGERFELSITTIHEKDRGETENIHKLNAKDLAMREIIYEDIADNSLIDKKDYKATEDPSIFQSEKTGRGKLTKGSWQKHHEPVMCAYKLIRIKFKVFGLESKTEKFIAKINQDMLFKFHRQLFCKIDQWFGLTMEDIRKLEKATQQQLKEKLNSPDMAHSTDNLDQKPGVTDSAPSAGEGEDAVPIGGQLVASDADKKDNAEEFKDTSAGAT